MRRERKRPEPPPPGDLSLGERAALARIEAALFGGDSGGEAPVIGRYRIVAAIGSGAFGRVYRARDPQLDRDVAIKLVGDGGGGPDAAARARLVREAQVMATVAHPNVAAVHDAGVLGEGDDARVFIAMELVDGVNLRDWLAAGAHPAAEVIEVMRQAGRGLAAAHAAGIVHRDFKPENILVGSDGRVRVVDFGLARAAGDEPADDGDARPPGLDPQQVLRTRTGQVIGTPAYMAPEQLEGRPASEASDQFSCCVVFWEAIHGRRPFAGRTIEELARAIRSGSADRAPGRRRAPRWLHRVIARGLAAAPAGRHPSMAALLAALASGPPRWQRRTALAAAAAMLVAAGALVARGRDADPGARCDGARAGLAGIWDARRREAIGAAFAATRLPYADATWSQARGAIDRWTDGWVAASSDACRATHVLGQQSPAMLDRRSACLRRQLRDAGSLIDLLARADPATVERAVQAAHSLPSVAVCADVDALAAPFPPPADPEARRRIDQQRDQLGRALALQALGRLDEAVTLARAVESGSAGLRFPPLAADAALAVAETLGSAGRSAESVEAARRAFDLALAASQTRTALHAATLVAFAGALDPSRRDESLRWVKTAASLLARVGPDAELEAKIANAEGNIHLTAGEPDAARPGFERAIAAFTRLHPDHPNIGSSLAMLGIADLDQGRLERAAGELGEALARVERTLGRDHPEVASTLINLSLAQRSRGAYAAAESSLRRALDLQSRVLAPDHPFRTHSHLALGTVLELRGRLAEAEAEIAEAERIALASYGPTHPVAAEVLIARAHLLVRRGQAREAQSSAERAAAILEKAMSADNPALAVAQAALAQAALAAGHGAPALAHADRGVALALAGFGEKSAQTALCRQRRGEVLLGLGRDGAAAAELARAEADFTAAMPDPQPLAEVRLARARALAGSDPAAAREAASQALFALSREADPRFAAEIRAWLARAPGAGREASSRDPVRLQTTITNGRRATRPSRHNPQ
jgi:eukaryotic-like serine/threonine-protein kinase